jgi:hypothetical protein
MQKRDMQKGFGPNNSTEGLSSSRSQLYVTASNMVTYYPKSLEGDIMQKRRQFLKTSMGIVGGFLLWTGPLFAVVRKAFARTAKIILPKGTAKETLIDKNPASLDTSNLDPVPLESFGTMGLSDYEVDLNQWRLEVTGCVKNPLRLSFEEMKALPSLERNVLLICPEGEYRNPHEECPLWRPQQGRRRRNSSDEPCTQARKNIQSPGQAKGC